jgi:hypothetical protein
VRGFTYFIPAGALALAACASDPVKRDPSTDPSNPDAPPSPPIRLTDALAVEEPAVERAEPDPNARSGDPHAGHGAPAGGQPQGAPSDTTSQEGARRDAPAGGAHRGHDQMDHGTHSAPSDGAGARDGGKVSGEMNRRRRGATRSGGASRDGGAPAMDHRSQGGTTAGGTRAGEATSGRTAHGAADGGSEEVVYACPMHPEVRQRGPGRCPKCGMKLVPEATGRGSGDEHKEHQVTDGGRR